MSCWVQLGPDLFVFRDSCNVYAVRGGQGEWLVFNPGTGSAADSISELGAIKQTTVLLTHHFRDHSAGAEGFRARGAKIAAPWHERHHLAGGQPAVRSKETLLLYDLMWDHYAPIGPLKVDRWLLDYEVLTLAGLSVEVIATPGVTLGASTYIATLRDGTRVAMIGELMSDPGKLARISPLQYNYNDLTGLENLLLSWRRVLAANPTLALPSWGEPIFGVAAAVATLRSSALRLESIHPGIASRLTSPSNEGVEEVAPRLFRARHSSAETYFVTSRAGKVLALDFGYDTAGIKFPSRNAAWTRRPLLHSWSDLAKITGAARIDVVIPTHYHDDHVAGVPLLQRLFGTEVWAAENFADLLERPEEFDRPCLWPEAIRVARRLPLGCSFTWEDVVFTLHAMSGHTEFSSLVLLEIDGQRVAHTGDQLFFVDSVSGRPVAPDQGSTFTNHVYRSGLALGCYRQFVGTLRAFDPHIVISGHHRPYIPDKALWDRVESAAAAFDEAHQSLMSLGEQDVHAGPDSVLAKIFPYHIRLVAGQSAVLRGWIRNPFGHEAHARVDLFMARAGWSTTGATLTVAPRAQGVFELVLHAPAGERCEREPIGLDLTVEGQRFGQVAEAWVSVS